MSIRFDQFDQLQKLIEKTVLLKVCTEHISLEKQEMVGNLKTNKKGHVVYRWTWERSDSKNSKTYETMINENYMYRV